MIDFTSCCTCQFIVQYHALQSLGFYSSRNIVVSGLTSINSQLFHMIVYKCNNTKVQGIKISAAADSPNTDGIHVQLSTGVSIMSSQISTGDDCVSIGPGTTNTWIESISCGPGHGIRYILIILFSSSLQNIGQLVKMNIY